MKVQWQVTACCAILGAAQAAITFNSASFPTCYDLVFTSRHFTALVRSYGLKQEFITPHCPQQNGMVERGIRTLKEQCVHRHRFESIQHAARVIGDWIGFYNNRRPHQALAMRTPAEAFRLAA
jgi:putative transposase